MDNKIKLANPSDPEMTKKYPIMSTPKATWQLVIELEIFIKYYTPKGWIGPIHEFDFAPYFTDQEMDIVLKGLIPDGEKFNKWYVIAAIMAWQVQQGIPIVISTDLTKIDQKALSYVYKLNGIELKPVVKLSELNS